MAFEFEPKDFGIETDINSKEEFFEAFTQKFINRTDAVKDKEIISKVTGKVLGSVSTKIRQAMGLTNETIEGDTPEAIVEFGVKKWEEKLSKGANNEDFTRQLDELQTKLKAKDQELMQANLAIEQKGQEYESKIKTYKVETKLNELVTKLPLRGDLTEIERMGMQTIIKSYDWREDEESGELMPYKDNEPVKNANKTANVKAVDFLTEKLSPLLSRSAGTPQPRQTGSYTYSKPAAGGGTEEKPKISPRALAAAAR